MDEVAVLDRLEEARSAWRVPSLAAALVRDGAVLWTGGVGQVDGRDGPRPTGDTQYRIGSITKSLTAALVLQARAAGRLALRDPVATHLDVDAVLGRVRLGDLLGHVGGIRAETSAPWWERSRGRTWEELRRDLADDVAAPAPAGPLHYSNPGYAVLGRVLEVVEGRSWVGLLQNRLLDPLGLGRTSARADGDDHAVPLAVHPERDDLLVEPASDYGVMAPAGQLWSSANDLGRWAEVLLGAGGEAVPPGLVATMARPRAVTTMDPPSAFGAGLQVLHQRGRALVGHSGSVPGFVATVFVDRAVGAGVAVLANSTTGFGSDLALDLLEVADPAGRAAADPARSNDVAPVGAAPTTDAPTGVLAAPAPTPVPTPAPTPAPTADVTAADPGPAEDLRGLAGTWYWGPRPVTVSVVGAEPVVDVGLPTRRSRFAWCDGEWVGRDGYFTGEVLAVARTADGGVGHLEVASMALTPGPYAPPEAVPGGIGDGWVPRRPDGAAGTDDGPAPRCPPGPGAPVGMG